MWNIGHVVPRWEFAPAARDPQSCCGSARNHRALVKTPSNHRLDAFASRRAEVSSHRSRDRAPKTETSDLTITEPQAFASVVANAPLGRACGVNYEIWARLARHEESDHLPGMIVSRPRMCQRRPDVQSGAAAEWSRCPLRWLATIARIAPQIVKQDDDPRNF